MSEEKEVLIAVKVPEGSQVCRVEIMPSNGFGVDMDDDIKAVDFRILEAGEPVAYKYISSGVVCFAAPDNPYVRDVDDVIPLYTSPQPDQSQEIAELKTKLTAWIKTAGVLEGESRGYWKQLAESREQLEKVKCQRDSALESNTELRIHINQSRAAAPQVVSNEHKTFVDWLSNTYPNSHPITTAEDYWRHDHVAALAWKARAILSTPPEAKGLAVGVPNGWHVQQFKNYTHAFLVVEPNGRSHTVFDTESNEEMERIFSRFCAALLATPPLIDEGSTSDKGESFQERVASWMQECFGPVIAADQVERNHRFLEEALELVQACGCTADEAHKLVDYTFGRDIGERSQEVGGVMVTLAALCLAQKIDLQVSAETELARIVQPEIVARIREKQKRKPSFSPLPGSYPDRPQSSEPMGENAWALLKRHIDDLRDAAFAFDEYPQFSGTAAEMRKAGR